MLKHLNVVSLPPKRVVVMGAFGFVGREVVRRLQRDQVPVLALGRGEVDLLAPNASRLLRSFLQPDDAFVAVSARAPVKNVDMLVENLIMARAMVGALEAASVSHIVNVSSDAIYADSTSPLSENSSAAPESLHGVMHLARELMFRAELKEPLAMVRPTLIYGPGDPHNGYGPNRFRRHVAGGQDIVLFGKGEERRDHVFIGDVADIITRILFAKSVGNLNIATGEVHSFREIAEKVSTLAGNPIKIKDSPRLGPIPHNGYRPFNTSACHKAFPDKRFLSLDEGIVQAQREENSMDYDRG